MSNADKVVVLRCFVEKRRNIYQAFCLNLNLAVQGDSVADVKERLESMIGDYLEDAHGVDKAHKEYLLGRRAPLSIFARYYWLRVRSWFGSLWSPNPAFERFNESVTGGRLAHSGS